MSVPAPPVADMKSPELPHVAVDIAQGNNNLHDTPETTDNKMFNTYGLDYLCCLNSCFILPERTSMVQLFFGNYNGTITEPGCYCRNSCFVELRKVSTATISVDLPNVKVADSRGNPLMVSGVVTYEVQNSRRAAIDVADPFHYVANQAPAVLKRVISQFPYQSASPDEPCLRTETHVVSAMMRDALQNRCNIAGIRIESFAINELSYAPEIAQSMLKRQQADALIDARQVCCLHRSRQTANFAALGFILVLRSLAVVSLVLPKPHTSHSWELTFLENMFVLTCELVDFATDSFLRLFASYYFLQN